MAEELTRSLTMLAERGEPRGADAVFRDAQPAAVPSPTARSRRPNSAVAAAAAAVVLVFVGLVVWLLQPFDSTEEVPVITRPDTSLIEETPPESAVLWRLEGTGTDFVQCPGCQQAGVLEITHTGSGRFIVTAFRADGTPDDQGIREANSGELFLGYRRIRVPDRRMAGSDGSALTVEEAAEFVNTTGEYRGVVQSWSIYERKPAALRVVADGAWTISGYEDPPRVFTDTLSGEGDEVVVWGDTPCDADHITLDYQGSGRFIALGSGAFGNSPLFFDEIGAGTYTNSALFESLPSDDWCERYFAMEIHADGPWTLTIVAAHE